MSENKKLSIVGVTYEGGKYHVEFGGLAPDGTVVVFAPDVFEEFQGATEEELRDFRISGGNVLWKSLNADATPLRLLKRLFAVTSLATTEQARQNGARGGRPSFQIPQPTKEDEAHSAELKRKTELFTEIGEIFEASGLTQKEIADRLGMHQPHVSQLRRRALASFSAEKLERILAQAKELLVSRSESDEFSAEKLRQHLPKPEPESEGLEIEG